MAANRQGHESDFLGMAILARTDPNKGFIKGNVYWRTAVSQEEADEQFELHIGVDLKKRFIDLRSKGLIELNQDFLDKIIELKTEA